MAPWGCRTALIAALAGAQAMATRPVARRRGRIRPRHDGRSCGAAGAGDEELLPPAEGMSADVGLQRRKLREIEPRRHNVPPNTAAEILDVIVLAEVQIAALGGCH